MRELVAWALIGFAMMWSIFLTAWCLVLETRIAGGMKLRVTPETYICKKLHAHTFVCREIVPTEKAPTGA